MWPVLHDLKSFSLYRIKNQPQNIDSLTLLTQKFLCVALFHLIWNLQGFFFLLIWQRRIFCCRIMSLSQKDHALGCQWKFCLWPQRSTVLHFSYPIALRTTSGNAARRHSSLGFPQICRSLITGQISCSVLLAFKPWEMRHRLMNF